MSAKTSHRRANGTTKRGGRTDHVELDMTAWSVLTDAGVMDTVYTLGTVPEGFSKAVMRDA